MKMLQHKGSVTGKSLAGDKETVEKPKIPVVPRKELVDDQMMDDLAESMNSSWIKVSSLWIIFFNFLQRIGLELNFLPRYNHIFLFFPTHSAEAFYFWFRLLPRRKQIHEMITIYFPTFLMVTGQWVWNNGYLESYFILHILFLVLHDEDELWVGNFAVFVNIEFVNSLLRLFHLKCTVSNNDSFVDFNFSRQELNYCCAVERGFKTIFLSAVEKLPGDKRDAK